MQHTAPWKIKNLPADHPARQKIVAYAKDNRMQVSAVIIKLAAKLK
jgi:hypothetical protein